MGAKSMAVDKRSGAAQRGDAILKRVGRNARGVEVGVFRGVLSQYLLRKGVARLFMVDTWAPAEEQPEHYRETKDYCAGLTVAECGANEAIARDVAARSGGKAVVLKLPSVVAAHQINDGSMDFVFLDADHSEFGVWSDLLAWAPKVKPGGWLAGHDFKNEMLEYDFSGVEMAVSRFTSETDLTVEEDDNFTFFIRAPEGGFNAIDARKA